MKKIKTLQTYREKGFVNTQKVGGKNTRHYLKSTQLLTSKRFNFLPIPRLNVKKKNQMTKYEMEIKQYYKTGQKGKKCLTAQAAICRKLGKLQIFRLVCFVFSLHPKEEDQVRGHAQSCDSSPPPPPIWASKWMDPPHFPNSSFKSPTSPSMSNNNRCSVSLMERTSARVPPRRLAAVEP